jgi:hypothetical protein
VDSIIKTNKLHCSKSSKTISKVLAGGWNPINHLTHSLTHSLTYLLTYLLTYSVRWWI